MVPKSKDFETLTPQPVRAARVVILAPEMLSPIHFNNQLCFKAHKVNNVGSYGGLAAELESSHLV